MARSLPTTGKIPRIRQLCLERITCSQLPTANRHPVGVDSWLAGGRLWIAISVFCLPFRSRSLFLRPFMHNTAAAVVRAVVMAVASLAGAAFVHGKVVMLPSPSMALDGQPRHTVRGQFAADFAPHKPFGANPFDAGFCDSFRFTWHSFLFPDDFDCFGNPFFSHRLFSRTLHGYFWSDSLFAGVSGAPPPSRWNRRRLRILPG